MKQAFAISQEQAVSILNYLAQQPYKEVAGLMQTLQTLPVVNINEEKPDGTEGEGA